MGKYLLKRFAILIPTLLGITIVVFGIVNLAPGSPVEQKLQQLRFSGGADGGGGGSASASRSSTANVSNEVLEALKKQYGFDNQFILDTGFG